MSAERPPSQPVEPIDRDTALAILVEGLAQIAADSPGGVSELDDLGARARSVLGGLPERISPSDFARAAERLEVPAAYLGSAERALRQRQLQLLAIWLGLGAVIGLVVWGLAR